MRGRLPAFWVLWLALLAAGCAQATTLARSEPVPQRAGEARVLLMQPDVELYELTAGGLLEPKAEWTGSAREYVTTALREELQRKGARVIPYQPPSGNPSKEHAHTQLVKLHDAVGGSILFFGAALPTKKGKLDWTLGEGVGVLRDDFGTDYGLFILLRDSYSSGGRRTLMVMGALIGVGVPGGRQVGFASLVDLRSGGILWFNQLVDPAGDLRTAEAAREAVKRLLENLPL